MQQQERYYPQMNSYNKPVSKTSMPVDEVEVWLKQFPQKRAENKPNGGIIRSVVDTRELFLRPMSKADRAAAIAQAQREHKQALKNLAKQEAMDAKDIAKQLIVWSKENKANGREMDTDLGQSVLDAFKSTGFYKASSFPKSKEYLRKIIFHIRLCGYQVRVDKQGRTILRYVLDKQ